MNIIEFKTDYRVSPIGIDNRKPKFSWKIGSKEKDVMQKAYRIIVKKEEFIVWDSSKVTSDKSHLVKYNGKDLESCSKYSVYVRIWDNKGNIAKAEDIFETGIFGGENFKAQWISHDFDDKNTACPVFSYKFNIDKKIKKARIYATALGVYQIKLNGKKVSDTYFAPGWTNYKKRLQYQTYCIDNIIHDKNEIEITVGNGWYKGILGFMGEKNHYGNRVGVIAQINLSFIDGTHRIIKTDKKWEVTESEIRYSELYMGETVDKTFENEKKYTVKETSYDNKNIVSQENEQVRITKRIKGKKFIITPKKEKVIDFGQNITGFVEVNIKGEKGQKIKVFHAETLDKYGNFYPDTLRSAKSIDTYICDGNRNVYSPNFTFHGFRYIRIEGLEDIDLDNYTACVLHTDMEKTGEFVTSNDLINRLQSNIEWSQRDNFLDIPTDCPQRNERLGWTGDAQVFAKTATYNMNGALFFKKWLRDLSSEQSKEKGVPHVIPNILSSYSSAGWSDAAVIIPWVIYQTYADKEVLEEQYESMKDWVEYIRRNTRENNLWQDGFQYGDWLALDKEEFSDRTGATDKYLAANAYYAYSTKLLRDTASILGKKEDENEYDMLFHNIKKAFNEEYITKTGRVVSETQTACILILKFGLAEDEYKERIINTLKNNIQNHKNHLTTGFLGTPYINHVLSENGLHDLAGELLLKEDYPSWLYAVKKGATTIWERWNSIKPNGDFDESGMNSLNHYAYGSIGEWMYKQLGGIDIIEAGYKKILIKPRFIKGITFVEASYESIYGKIYSKWECSKGKISIEVQIPPNTTAVIDLPEKEDIHRVGSGKYSYEYSTNTNLKKEKYSLETTLKTIINEPLAVKFLEKNAPEIIDNPMIKLAYDLSISDMLSNAPQAEPIFKKVIEILNDKENMK